MKIFDIIREEAARGGYTAEQIQARNLTPRICKLRQYAMWRARKETGRSWTAIGQAFKRDHTTVLHACQKIEAMAPNQRTALPPLPVKRVKPVKPAKMIEPPKSRAHLYFWGRDCPKGHGGRRYVATGECIECKRLRDNRRRHGKKDLDFRDGRAFTTSSGVAVE